jgi:trigger factor
LKVSTEDLGSRQVMLTIEVDEQRVERTLRGVARRVSRDYSIPGFRRGRAPFSVILQRFGREALLQEAMEDLIRELYEEALESEGLEPYDIGSLDDVQLDPLVFKLRVPLRPTVDLGNYRELRVEPPVVTVEEEEIDDEVERLREANALLEPAGDRTAEMGDWISVDVSAVLAAETLVREDAHEMVLDAEDGEFEDGFAQQVVGLKPDEEKQFGLTLSEDWGETRVGQEATFTVTLREVRSRTLPDPDDDLARTVGDYDTIEELRQSIRDRFDANAQREADAEYTDEVFDAFVAEATIEYPPDMVETQIDSIVGDVESRLQPQGISLEDYFKLSGQSEEEFRESVRPRAVSFTERGLLLGELARVENLDVEGQEVEERIALLTSQWGERAGEVRDMLSAPDSVRSIASGVLTDKTAQRMLAIARGEAPPLEEADAGASGEPAEADEVQEPTLTGAEPAESSIDEQAAEGVDEPQETVAQTADEESEDVVAEVEAAPLVEAESSTEVD